MAPITPKTTGSGELSLAGDPTRGAGAIVGLAVGLPVIAGIGGVVDGVPAVGLDVVGFLVGESVGLDVVGFLVGEFVGDSVCGWMIL